MKIKKTMRINTANIPDEYQPLVKDEMTRQEIALLGTVILKDKYVRLKNRLFGWWYARKKHKGKDRESV